MGARYVWERFAAATIPRLPSSAGTSSRVKIPWPKRAERPKFERMGSLFVRGLNTEMSLKLRRTPQRLKM